MQKEKYFKSKVEKYIYIKSACIYFEHFNMRESKRLHIIFFWRFLKSMTDIFLIAVILELERVVTFNQIFFQGSSQRIPA